MHDYCIYDYKSLYGKPILMTRYGKDMYSCGFVMVFDVNQNPQSNVFCESIKVDINFDEQGYTLS